MEIRLGHATKYLTPALSLNGLKVVLCPYTDRHASCSPLFSSCFNHTETIIKLKQKGSV
jgi:hypothetical protein